MRVVTTPWTSPALASDLFAEMDKFFPVPYVERAFTPAAEIDETEERFLVSVDLPGVKKEEIKIEVDKNILTISGERKAKGIFKRSFTLPTTVDVEKIEARSENGVLELHLPKVAAVKPRQIEIQTSL